MSSENNTPQIFEPDYYQQLYDIEEGHGWAQGMRDSIHALKFYQKRGTSAQDQGYSLTMLVRDPEAMAGTTDGAK